MLLKRILKFFTRHHLPSLLWAFLLFLLGGGTFWIHQNQEPISIDEKYKDYIQKRVISEIEVLRQESKEIEELFQENNVISLIEVKKKHRYPCIIFRNEQLLFWSDNRFIPDYDLITGNYTLKFFELQNGFYIFHREFFKTNEGNRIEIYTYLPLQVRYSLQNKYLTSQINPNIFPSEQLEISKTPTSKQIFTEIEKGEYLFSLSYSTRKEAPHLYWFALSLICNAGAFVMLFIFIWKWQAFFQQKKLYEFFIAFFVLYWLLVRWLMLKNLIPYSFWETDLFNPQLYASSFWSPSLGDLLINLFLGLWIVFLLQRNFPKTLIFQKISPKKKIGAKYWASLMLIFLSYVSFYEVFGIFSSIFTNSQLVLDISQNIHFHLPHWAAFGVFVVLSTIYFLLLHLVGRLLIRFLDNDYPKFALLFGLATILHSSIAYFTGNFEPFLSLLNGIYLLILYFFRLPQFLYRFRNISILYLLIGSLWCAIAGTYALRYFSTQTQKKAIGRFAENLLLSKDFKTELTLDNIVEEIQLDLPLKLFFKASLSVVDKSTIEKRIRKQYIKNEFPDYEVDVLVFDNVGFPISKNTQIRYADWVETYQKPQFRTDRTDRFFINETQAIEQKIDLNLFRMYIDFIEIKQSGQILGYVIITLKKRKTTSFKVYPVLLRNEKTQENTKISNLSYAIFRTNNAPQQNSQLIYSQGDCNYYKNFKEGLFRIQKLYQQGYEFQGYKHFAFRGENGKIVVISLPEYAFKNTFANFSLLFLLLITLVALILSIYGLINYYQRKKITLATRIQIFLNLAFFFPLVIFSITTLQVVSRTYENDLNQKFLQKAENASNSLLSAMQSYAEQMKTREELQREVNSVALYAQSDLNLFDTKGKLLVTSQPAIYESRLLSKNIAPEALWQVVERKENSTMLAENIGNLNYKAVYWAIRSFENNQLLAILNIPFFDAEDERDKKLTGIFTTIINIFTIIFLIFVITSYFTSNLLTEPLAIITQKIRRTTLQTTNEPLQWDSDDEIGLLVNEYNKMLIKLDASKKALAQSEKEAAWRQMAKQVAHEIKNPLTPMKLTLEHLKMRISRDFPQMKTITEKPFETLLEQIDLLSEIASSFASFARMSEPKSEEFDIAYILRQTLLLYENDTDIHLIRHLEKGKFIVKGDKQLMTQIFTNIILNAKQAVPSDRNPEIFVALYKTDDNKVHIEIRDNGSGIPEEIQHKVFLPNFSTKFTGSGIGLALAKQGIEHAGGKIWFETEKDIGTCFYIELPLISISE
jgi:nitrogen fixation/metabolism regulation signal transduction histidine kinase